MATYYLSNTDITALKYEKLEESAPSTLDEAQGWTVDKKASLASPYKPDTIQASTTFVTEPLPFGALGYRTLNALSGNFAAGNWILAFKVKNDATYYAQKGYVKFRLWRSTNADGSGATQITPGWRSSAVIGFTAGGQYKTGTITWAGGAVALANEYLFLEIEWYASTSGGNNAAVVYWVHNEGVAEKIDTPTFTEGHSDSALISGNGSLVGAAQKGGKGSALASGKGALVTLVIAGMLGLAGISGGGSLVATGEKFEGEPHYGSAVISGGGAVSSEGVKDAKESLAVSGNGSLIASGKKEASSSIFITGNGGLQGIGLKAGAGLVVVQGEGGLVGEGTKEAKGIGLVSGTGTLEGTAEKESSGLASISGGGSLTASGEIETEQHSGSSLISGNGLLASAGEKKAFSSAIIIGNGSITGTALKEGKGMGSISGGGSIRIYGKLELIKLVNLSSPITFDAGVRSRVVPSPDALRKSPVKPAPDIRVSSEVDRDAEVSSKVRR